ncbi:MAG: 4,5:9,10-diseco-3-hydroxy-5,9,17-trioxoandrosta-1(10),2-diene-4-oate hydrolase [Acidobacteria bacterium]|nr:4,5:9,10-diseco-3-hydroxy-5,9,17-trioxoandrosta-1(10),2-diene-4-oate hydrolase [Acidobacteriota bacterium]
MTKRVLRSAILLIFAFIAVQAQSPTPESKNVEIFGQKIHYLEAGSTSNPAVILLHGLGGDTSNWALTIPALSGKYHVYVPDQVGFGKSDKPITNYRVAMLVEFLDVFCKKLGIQKAALVGNSLGGWTAAAFAIAHPEKVDKLVLVDAAGYTPKRWGGPEITKEALAALNPSTTEDFKRLFGLILYNKAMLTDQFVEQALTNKLKRGDGYTINSFIESVLRGEDYLDGKTQKIKAPTLVLWGKDDGLTPLGIGKAFAEDIRGAQLVAIDKCGHVPQMEKAAEFNAALLKFLGAGHTAQVQK